MISVFDYLGRAGGKELCGRINLYAKKVGAKFEKIRDVSNPKYTGLVTLYEEEFLDEYVRVHPEENLKKAVIGTNR
jgi:hypothetical protein